MLGEIIAVDTFLGNHDRMMATPQGGWFNAGNILVTKQGQDYGARAIDNDIGQGTCSKDSGPEGMRPGSMSTMCVNPLTARKEAEVLFDFFVEQLKLKSNEGASDDSNNNNNNNSNSTGAIESRVNGFRQSFIEGVGSAANEKLQFFVARGRHWKAQFCSDGISVDNLISDFRLRKRMLRIMNSSDDVSPSAAYQTAKDDTNWQKWALTAEFGYDKDAANEVVEGGIEAYRNAKTLGPMPVPPDIEMQDPKRSLGGQITSWLGNKVDQLRNN